MTARKRKPKPVRAWATLSLLTGQINRCTDATRAECIDTCGFVGETDYKPVRVTIIPDGTPSQAAEVRRLRGEVNRLRRALTFYANENAYAYQGDIHLMGSVIAERGNIARVTLAGGDPMGNADRSLRRAQAKDAALRGRRGR